MERRGTKGKRPVLKNYGFLGVMLLSMFSVLFGFAANMAGGPETAVAKWLRSMTETMLQFVKLVTYYAPVAFFAIFANLVADKPQPAAPAAPAPDMGGMGGMY